MTRHDISTKIAFLDVETWTMNAISCLFILISFSAWQAQNPRLVTIGLALVEISKLKLHLGRRHMWASVESKWARWVVISARASEFGRKT